MNNILSIIWDYISFLDKIFSNLEESKINVSHYELDHLCYRVETQKRYDEVKKIFTQESRLLSETMIWSRPISTFTLPKPLIYKSRKIYVVEIPAPKKISDYPEWLEHVEFVIDKSFEEFKNLYSEITFDTRAEWKKINPDIQVRYDDCSVKFHHNSLEYVIKYLE